MGECQMVSMAWIGLDWIGLPRNSTENSIFMYPRGLSAIFPLSTPLVLFEYGYELHTDTCFATRFPVDLVLFSQDIIDSVMGNMGFLDSESYGLTWKVRGFCVDKSNPEVFDRTGVYGEIQNSEIYGMYYGVYTYGHDGGEWTNNVMRDNIQYGFDPHDDSDNLVIANNEVYGNGNHGERVRTEGGDVLALTSGGSLYTLHRPLPFEW